MQFIEKNDINEKFYSVNYDKEKLIEILEKLKRYSYVATRHVQLAGDITRWPATEKNIKKRVIYFFYETNRDLNATIHPETIVHHKENNNNYVTYDYSYTKLPDLYDYIDLIVNKKSILNYIELFGERTKEATGTLNMFYAAHHYDQFVLEGLLNYANSLELTNHDFGKDKKTSKEEYDYKGLNELYKKTLECFNFHLIAVKEYLKEPEPVNVLSLKLKK